MYYIYNRYKLVGERHIKKCLKKALTSWNLPTYPPDTAAKKFDDPSTWSWKKPFHAA